VRFAGGCAAADDGVEGAGLTPAGTSLPPLGQVLKLNARGRCIQGFLVSGIFNEIFGVNPVIDFAVVDVV